MGRRDDARAYVESVLERDPWSESETILEERRRFLGHAPGPAAARVSSAAATGQPAGPKRSEVRAALESLRAEFLELEAAEVDARLGALDAGAFPDLDDWRGRLAACAERHDRFVRAAEDEGVRGPGLDAFFEIALAREEDARELRTRLLNGLGASGVRNAKRVQKAYPELAALETDWFARVRSKKRDAKLAKSPVGWGSGFFVVWAILRLIATLLRD